MEGFIWQNGSMQTGRSLLSVLGVHPEPLEIDDGPALAGVRDLLGVDELKMRELVAAQPPCCRGRSRLSLPNPTASGIGDRRPAPRGRPSYPMPSVVHGRHDRFTDHRFRTTRARGARRWYHLSSRLVPGA